MRDAADFGNEGFQSRSILHSNELPTGSEFALGIEFSVGSERNGHVVNIAWSPSTVAFGALIC